MKRNQLIANCICFLSLLKSEKEIMGENLYISERRTPTTPKVKKEVKGREIGESALEDKKVGLHNYQLIY